MRAAVAVGFVGCALIAACGSRVVVENISDAGATGGASGSSGNAGGGSGGTAGIGVGGYGAAGSAGLGSGGYDGGSFGGAGNAGVGGSAGTIGEAGAVSQGGSGFGGFGGLGGLGGQGDASLTPLGPPNRWQSDAGVPQCVKVGVPNSSYSTEAYAGFCIGLAYVPVVYCSDNGPTCDRNVSGSSALESSFRLFWDPQARVGYAYDRSNLELLATVTQSMYLNMFSAVWSNGDRVDCTLEMEAEMLCYTPAP